tara:strand:- start:42 stop:1067 length:1026 start_codon:yes stop_codon:yes gene_type:complete
MTYIPKNQIKSNLFTSGNELVTVPDYAVYIGYYWKKSTGQKYTGRTPSDGPNQRLIPVTADIPEEQLEDIPLVFPLRVTGPTTTTYDTITENRYKPIRNPRGTFTKPTQRDYTNGFFYRYFTKKRNQNTLYEISKEDYQLLNDNSNKINRTLYRGIKVRWSISNKKREDIFLINKNIVRNLENSRNFYGLFAFFKDDWDQYFSDKIGIIYVNGKRHYIDYKPVPDNLPPAYQYGNKNTISNPEVPPNQNCANCIFRQRYKCNKWDAVIKKDYWCSKYEPQEYEDDNAGKDYSSNDKPSFDNTNNVTYINLTTYDLGVTGTPRRESSTSFSSNYSSGGSGGY